jgi:hypothetical protein
MMRDPMPPPYRSPIDEGLKVIGIWALVVLGGIIGYFIANIPG